MTEQKTDALLGCEISHGSPFRYCSCGWMEETAPQSLSTEIESEHVEISDAEKLDYVFRKFLEIDSLIEQAGPLLTQAAPLLEQFTGQASSPFGRIAASFLR